MTTTTVHRLAYGTFVRPASETETGQPRVEVAYGYLVRHPDLTILFDTGIGAADDETEAHYRPSRVPLAAALATAGARLDEVDLVVNCHLHFDHCGANPSLAGRPVVVQRTELATARAGGYTFDELVDFRGASYEELDGEAELAAGVLVIPTPGHVPGHQSMAVRRADGWVVLAGQSHEHVSDFTADALAVAARAAGVAEPLPPTPPWMERLLGLDPVQVLLAQDTAVWHAPRLVAM